jgi:hypothetical protein
MKKTLLTLSAVLVLAGCQTTGTTTTASNIPNGLTPSDSQMTCAQINAEFAQLDQIITAAGDAKMNQQMTSAGASAATQAAYQSGAASSVPYIGSLIGFANNMNNINSQQQQQQAQAAMNRRNQLLGLAQGKGCM